MKITTLTGTKYLSSLGNDTIKVSLSLENNLHAAVTVPAGISAGKYEAKIVPAATALAEVDNLTPALLAGDWTQASLDAFLVTKGLGGNTTIAISAAFWKADMVEGKKCVYHKPPKLLLLLFEGAKHGNPNLTIQEFMLVEDTLASAIADFKTMRTYLSSQGIEATVGAEGGFSPINFTNLLVLEVMQAVFPKGTFALDAAGSFTTADQNLDQLIADFHIGYLEDPFTDEQWQAWTTMTTRFGHNMLIVGDDLTTTNPSRITKAITDQAINAVIIKPNQNGTITGTLKAVETAKAAGLKIIVSHRGEETDDDWLVDFALCVGADYVKFGGMDRGERVAKYNRLLELGVK